MRKLKSIFISFENLKKNRPVGEVKEKQLARRIKEELLGAADVLSTDEIPDGEDIYLEFEDTEGEVFTGSFKGDTFFVKSHEFGVKSIDEL